MDIVTNFTVKKIEEQYKNCHGRVSAKWNIGQGKKNTLLDTLAMILFCNKNFYISAIKI